MGYRIQHRRPLFTVGTPPESLASGEARPWAWKPTSSAALALAVLFTILSFVAVTSFLGLPPFGGGPAAQAHPDSSATATPITADRQLKAIGLENPSVAKQGPSTNFKIRVSGLPHGPIAVPIQYLTDEKDYYSDGVCLNGSPPAFHMSRGWGEGAHKWLVYLEGGGWCESAQRCRERVEFEKYGDSWVMERMWPFGGILSNSSHVNPYFFDWNIVFVRYCDGSSFAGMANNVTEDGLHLRGQRVFLRVMAHLLHKEGMSNATHALLGGCSAGALAALLHCDKFQEMLTSASPHPAITVKCLSDAGFFPEYTGMDGKASIKDTFSRTAQLHQPMAIKECLASADLAANPGACMFPENFVQYIRTPVFISNPLYDLYMLQYQLMPGPHTGRHDWEACWFRMQNCSAQEMAFLHEYKHTVEQRILDVLKKKGGGGGSAGKDGAFLYACRAHCIALWDERWLGPDSMRLKGVRIGEAVGQWFYDETDDVVRSDCDFPCNPTCNPHASAF